VLEALGRVRMLEPKILYLVILSTERNPSRTIKLE
jgi:hypothetical protein